MADKVTAKWHGLEEFRKKLNVKSLLDSLDDIVRTFAEDALLLIRERTPRGNSQVTKDPGFKHTADLWELKKLGPAHYVIDHPYNYVMNFEGREVNSGSFSLLMALEYGTRPHPIGPAKMTFFWDRKNEWATFEFVNHPGIVNPPAMVRVTESEIRPLFNTALRIAVQEHFG